jgi:hypothetical protein
MKRARSKTPSIYRRMMSSSSDEDERCARDYKFRQRQASALASSSCHIVPMSAPQPSLPSSSSTSITTVPKVEHVKTTTVCTRPKEDWRAHRILENARHTWPHLERGIVNVRPIIKEGRRMVAGRVLAHALQTSIRILNEAGCLYKVGMCFCMASRWEFYMSETCDAFVPQLMYWLADTDSRDGAWYLEAALIRTLQDRGYKGNSMNYARNDFGGEGPQRPEIATMEHHVYLIVQHQPQHRRRQRGVYGVV